MPTPLLAALLAFVATLLSTPALAALARRLGVVDVPGGRKAHADAIPLLGGVAIAVGIAAGVIASGEGSMFAAIFGGAAIVFVIGLVDDLKGAPVWLRLLVEVGAASLVVATGTQATFLVGIPWITIPVTIVWIVGITNAFNFIDNMDGLSAGVAAISATVFMLVCITTGQPQEAAVLAAIAGGALGFLPWNFKPARIFMGDCGALTIGFLLGSLSVAMEFYSYQGTILPLATPLLVLALPLFDVGSVLVIRFREGRALTKGDRSHFSHRLVALGMSERVAVTTLYLASAAIGLGAVLLRKLTWWEGSLLLVQAALVFAIVVLTERAGLKRTSNE